MLKISQLHKDTITPTNWSGGKTYEYFIYPKDSQYNQRNFLVRISSATIEDTPSVFTKFDYYQRYLVMLTNDLKVNINQQDKLYPKGELFKFQSSDEVLSYSQGDDFNLMLSQSVSSHYIEVNRGSIEMMYNLVFVFAMEDTSVLIDEKKYLLSANDLLVVESDGTHLFTLFLDKTSIIGGCNLF